MRNPSPSIFEPLFSQDAPLPPTPTPPSHLSLSSSSEWLTSAYSPSPYKNLQLRKAPTTIFSFDPCIPPADTSCDSASAPAPHEQYPNCGPIHHDDHGKPSSVTTDHTLADSSPPSAPPTRSLSLSHVDRHDDDGSVATKLLASITKSISSPSLLSCCKESARETPYQKRLKLRTMKLQHCAEELGSESFDCTSTINENGTDRSFDSLFTRSSSRSESEIHLCSCARSPSSTITQTDGGSECDATPMMISSRSAPNLRCSSFVARHTGHVRERSFPPPLTHTLPRSASSDSFAFSLRPYREDGRLMLKEVKLPRQQYLQANRKDGRLTLKLFNADDDVEQESYGYKELEGGVDLEQEEIGDDMGGQSVTLQQKGEVGCSYGDKVGVGFASREEVVEVGLEVVGVDVDEIGRKFVDLPASLDARKDGGLGAERLPIATSNGHLASNPPALVCLRALPSPWKLNTLPPGNIPRLKVTPVTRFSQCEEDLVLQKRRSSREAQQKGVKAMLEVEIVPTSLQGDGFGTDDPLSLSPTIVFEDIDANSVREIVRKLVSSFRLDGCSPSKGLAASSQWKGSYMYDGITSIDIGVRKHNDRKCGPPGPHISARHEEGGGCTGGDVSISTKPTALHVDVQMPIQLDWVHNLHCKELLGRNQYGGKGYSWVAIRS